MAATRLLARLVTTTGSVSAGAVRTLREQGEQADDALTIVPHLIRLIAETICHHQRDVDEPCLEDVAGFLARLVERYGTIRRAIESLANAKRRHDSVSVERARAWQQAMCVTPGAIEPMLKRHATLLIQITRWMTERGPTLERDLERYVEWLDAPLEEVDFDLPGREPRAPAASPVVEADGAAGEPVEETPDIHLVRDSFLNDKHPTELPGSRLLDP
ncbi:MAG: hypothetical protein KDA21_09465, partial [Phycisphaerales bacterium]|nr:hypothetical protein [Phycisphaerales bacterium]